MPDDAPATEVQVVAEPLLVAPDVAARLLGMSRAMLDKLETAGKIGPKPMRLGRKVLWSPADLRRWIDAGCPGCAAWLAQQERSTTPRLAAG